MHFFDAMLSSLDNMILLDLRVTPGNSGGPLCDVQGNVIGMITTKIGGGAALPLPSLFDVNAVSLGETATTAHATGNWSGAGNADNVSLTTGLLYPSKRRRFGTEVSSCFFINNITVSRSPRPGGSSRRVDAVQELIRKVDTSTSGKPP